MTPLRPLILQPDSEPYGACRALLRTIEAMPDGSVSPVVVFPYDGLALEEYAAAGCEVVVEPGLAVLRRSSAGPRGLARLLRDARRSGASIARLCRARGAHLVHSNSATVVSGAWAARGAGIPHVWQVREAPKEAGLRRAALRTLMRARADRVIAVSKAAAAVGPPSMQPLVVYDGFDPPPAAGPTRAGRSIAPDAFLAGMVGRVSPTKAQVLVAEAIGGSPALADTHLALAGTVYPGNEDYAARLLERAHELGMARRLHCLGWLEDGTQLTRQLDALVIATAHGEGFPASVLEALALGVPVVSAASGGVDELVLDGRTGLVVPPDDAAALGAALARLQRDPTLGATLARGGREHAARWSAAASAHQMLGVWTEAAGRAAP